MSDLVNILTKLINTNQTSILSLQCMVSRKLKYKNDHFVHAYRFAIHRPTACNSEDTVKPFLCPDTSPHGMVSSGRATNYSPTIETWID